MGDTVVSPQDILLVGSFLVTSSASRVWEEATVDVAVLGLCYI